MKKNSPKKEGTAKNQKTNKSKNKIFTKEVIKTASKDQIKGIRSYRRACILCLNLILCLSLWLKVGLNNDWHLNDVLIEVISLFIINAMGIVANIKNNFPIFNTRKFKFTKNISYSIVLFTTLFLFFLIYKNLVNPEFISYLAGLSIHSIVTILVFLIPIFLFIIYIIYIGLNLFDTPKEKESLETYNEKIEASLDSYKNITIKFIFFFMLLSLWVKIGLLIDLSLPNIIIELSSIITILTLTIVGNIDNKLPPLYNYTVYLDKYFIYSLLLPYLLILLYSIFSKDFRVLIDLAGFKQFISIIVSMTPLFFIASALFYKGARLPENKEVSKKVKNNIRSTAIISLIISLVIIFLLFYYALTTIIKQYSLENILQIIILFIPLSVILYLIIYSCIKEINK